MSDSDRHQAPLVDNGEPLERRSPPVRPAERGDGVPASEATGTPSPAVGGEGGGDGGKRGYQSTAYGSDPYAAEDEVHFLDCVRVLYKRRWVAITSFLIV